MEEKWCSVLQSIVIFGNKANVFKEEATFELGLERCKFFQILRKDQEVGTAQSKAQKGKSASVISSIVSSCILLLWLEYRCRGGRNENTELNQGRGGKILKGMLIRLQYLADITEIKRFTVSLMIHWRRARSLRCQESFSL